ncbi:MAG: C4-type zinc ribbon domain-containing protein [Sphaerochaetaceae bacterium]|nr:C4-type zinc ribbon domain-containing protein [Sphaerochaetaceae bacterium]
MKDTFVKLQKLQKIIAKMYEIEDKIKEVPNILEVKQSLLAKTNKTYLELIAKENDLKGQVNELKKTKMEAEIRRENLEKSVETIVLSREYETLAKDIEYAKNEEQRTRNLLIEKQKRLDEIQDRISIQEEIFKSQTQEVEEETSKKDENIRLLQEELDVVNKQKESFSKDIPEHLLFKFKRIIRNKENVGIVPIHGNVCEGCHMALPVQFVNDVRKEDEILFCPYCSRVLYYEDVNVEEATPMEEMTEENEPSLSEFVDDDEFSDF